MSSDIRLFRTLRAILLAGVLAGFSACQVLPPPVADTTRFYVLGLPDKNTVTPAGSGLRVGLKPVEVAAYLRAPGIVVRRGEHEVSFGDLDRWGESLAAGVQRTLERSLEAAPTIGRVIHYPFPTEAARDFDVDVRVEHCEGSVDAQGKGTASFTAVYSITTTGAGAELAMQRTFVAPPVSWDGSDYDALVRGLSDAVAKLADDIALQIDNVNAQPRP